MSKKTSYNVAIVGATGAVGETLLSVLAERDFPVGELIALASERTAGGKVDFAGKQVVVKNLADFDFAGVDIAFFQYSHTHFIGEFKIKTWADIGMQTNRISIHIFHSLIPRPCVAPRHIRYTQQVPRFT